MTYFNGLWQRTKHKSFLRLLHDGFIKLGINISFFYLVEEGLHLQKIPFSINEFTDYTTEFLKEDEIDSICSIHEKPYKKEKISERIKSAKCIVVKKDGNVIAYTWFNFSKYTFGNYEYTLKGNEAYLFDAYVLMEYRGKKLAPFMRYQCYKELEKLNKTILYSFSDVLNKQSIRFKQKLNAKFVSLFLYISLFNKLKLCRQLKKLP